MSKLIMSVMVGLVILSVLSAFMDGGGYATTVLTRDMAIDDVHCDVISTTGFLATPDIIWIEDEKILYTTTNATAFLGLTRGYEETDNATHVYQHKVFTESTNALNTALGFNAGAIAATQGMAALVIIPLRFFTVTLPKIVFWNYSFLQGDSLLGLVRYILIAITLVVFVVVAVQFYQLIKPK